MAKQAVYLSEVVDPVSGEVIFFEGDIEDIGTARYKWAITALELAEIVGSIRRYTVTDKKATQIIEITEKEVNNEGS